MSLQNSSITFLLAIKEKARVYYPLERTTFDVLSAFNRLFPQQRALQ